MRKHIDNNKSQVKMSLSLGGWNFNANSETASIFGDMSATPENRSKFIKSTISFCRKYGFDGIDIDWEVCTVHIEAHIMVSSFISY